MCHLQPVILLNLFIKEKFTWLFEADKTDIYNTHIPHHYLNSRLRCQGLLTPTGLKNRNQF
jgi:hypothetical protein